jgi:hypothetical protein
MHCGAHDPHYQHISAKNFFHFRFPLNPTLIKVKNNFSHHLAQIVEFIHVQIGPAATGLFGTGNAPEWKKI